MTRDEEFNDIPELGPARDALDTADIPTLKATAEKQSASPSASRLTASSAADKSASGLMPWLMLLLMVVIGAGGYWGLIHFNQLQKQLIQANLRIADLEGLINATDESANKSGAALQAQIKKFLQDEDKRAKHVNSELAKLWTVAYQRNKPKIAEIDKSVAELGKQTDELQKQQAQNIAGIDNAVSGFASVSTDMASFDQTLQLTTGNLKDLESQMRLSDQANQELDSLQDIQFSEFEKKLAEIQRNPQVPQALADTVKEQQQAIEAINSFRKQANSEMLRLASRIDQLQRAAKQASVPAPNQ
ncbi:MAG: hypothetical protein V7707_17710 [Motiliproteus sp.]